MERKTLMSESLRDHSIGAQDNFNPPKPSNMFKGSWIAATAAYQSYGDHHHHHHHPAHHEYVSSGGLSWPPRSYSCTFCKREFRSAQALGGHMNVHRRDRARLRQSSPPPPTSSSSLPASSDGQYTFLSLNPGNSTPALNHNPNPSPNPNLPPYSSSPLVPVRPYPQAPPNAISSPFTPRSHLDISSLASRFGPTCVKKVPDEDCFNGQASRGKEDQCPWSKGLINLGTDVEVVKEDLDLELRLGCP